jgi:hypothetical protein
MILKPGIGIVRPKCLALETAKPLGGQHSPTAVGRQYLERQATSALPCSGSRRC